MLFSAANVYAAGQPGTPLAPGQKPLGQNVDLLGRYNLNLQNPNVWIGIVGILVVAWLVHRHGRGKR